MFSIKKRLFQAKYTKFNLKEFWLLYSNAVEVRSEAACYRFTLKPVAHTLYVIAFLLTSIVYKSAWKESLYSVIAYHRKYYMVCAAVFEQNLHFKGQITTIFLRSHSLQSFPLSKYHDRNKIPRLRGNPRECNNAVPIILIIPRKEK